MNTETSKSSTSCGCSWQCMLRRWAPEALVILIFAAISFAYFFPADIEGRILYQHDSSAGRGAGQEINEYRQSTGETTRWTNSLFCGMPTYQLAPSYKSATPMTMAADAYHLWLPDYVWYLFAYLLGFYILLRAFDFRRHLATLGAVLWGFSTYFLIIIAAGHIWKVVALAYLPPLIAGIVLAFRGKYLPALIVTTIFTAFEINANHVQMTYYYLFVILLMVIAYLIDAIRTKRMVHFAKAASVCIIGAVLGIMMNISNLYHTYQYSKESMRGKSELLKADNNNQTNSGLERDYITQWSYGIDETWTLLIPNAKGGSHHIRLASDTKAMEQCESEFSQYVGQWYQYWGEQPFTAGPVYVGAFVMTLFLLSLFIVKGPVKWALLAATILSVLLSWGKNFMPFTDFFIDYVPMYAKFRTVSSILVIAEFTIPLMAMLALKRLIDEPQLLRTKQHWIYLSTALTAGCCLLFAIAPTAFFDFISSRDSAQLQQYIPQEYLDTMLSNISKVREAVFTADCWRSFFIIIVGTLLLLVYRTGKMKTSLLVGCLLALCLWDLWAVNKRYLYDGMFVDKSVKEQPVEMTSTEEMILRDKSLYYRTLNLATDTYNENETSYYLKSIGGYHPAKLRRYQEMVEHYISKQQMALANAVVKVQGDMTKINGDSIYPVLNMLNTKYIIFPLQDRQTVPIANPYAYGNAWFVDDIKYVNNANEELDAVGTINLRHCAVADKQFADVLQQAVLQDSTSIATLTAYAPNKLTYEVNSDKGGVLVFSEIYYPGWTATIDNEEATLGRVNYILRAVQVKPGKHTIVLSFDPQSVKITESIAYTAYIILAVVLVLIVFMAYRRKKTNCTE